MTKTTRGTGPYAGGDKHSFPRHRQEHEKSCGPACLRMIAEWLTGVPQSEYAWRVRSGWTATDGLKLRRMSKVLLTLPKRGIISRCDPHQIARVEDDEVYLLFTDSYWYDGRNYEHWVVLLHLFRSVERKGRASQLLALYADPMEDALAVWSWDGLLASRVHHAFKITKP